MNCIILAALASAVLGATPIDDTKTDQKELQGKWIVTSGVIDGNAIPKDQIKGHLTHNGEKYTWSAGGDQKGSGKFKIDSSKKPKTMDCVPADGPLEGQTVEEIYELNGDTLKICFAFPGNPRPTEFKSEAGSGRWLFTYRRAK
jgi:uncharacterized protein (TIGR03067 family)